MVLSDEERATLDTRDASEFYKVPRIGVQHAGPEFLRRLSDLYVEVLEDLRTSAAAANPLTSKDPSAAAAGDAEAASTAGAPTGNAANAAAAPQQQGQGQRRRAPLMVLDLCSSWTTHLPPSDVIGGEVRVLGHGINADELEANSGLTSWFVQDLDADPTLTGMPEGSFNAVLCSNGIYYLKQMEAVVAEVARVLVPGGAFVVSFGEDCFRERALAGVLGRTLDERAELITRVLRSNGFSSVRDVSEPSCSFRALVASAALACPAPPAPPPRLTSENVADVLWSPAISHPLPPHPAGSPPPGAADVTDHGGSLLSRPDGRLAAIEWRAAYGALCAEARELGIPASAIPVLPEDDADLTVELLQAKQRHLQDMLASFLSANL